MNKKRQITLNVSSLDECTQVKASAEGILGNIYFLESKDCRDFFYYVQLPNSWWIEKEFNTELDAIKFLADYYTLPKKYKNIFLKQGYYTNSERGAITYRDNIESINLGISL